MAKKADPREASPQDDAIVPKSSGLLAVTISHEMRTAYLDYAMSVITARALPDARDGLKPVHRRILFAMNNMGLTPGAKFRKSATVVGEVLGNYHPHGDASVYDAMTKTAQDFSYRYPLVQGQGNFGCFTKDTKVRLADGRSPSFGELVEEDKQKKRNYIFTIEASGKVGIALLRKPRLTKHGAEIMAVILDNGEVIRCTLDHRFLLKDQSYVEAQYLKPGMSLMPLYTRLSTKDDMPLSGMEGYEMVLHGLEKRWEFVHHLADAYNLKQNIYSLSEGKVRHHVDFNKLNNSPENIKRMQWSDHWHLHSELTANRHAHDPVYVEKLKLGRDAYWADQKHRQEYSERLSKRNSNNWKDPLYREKMRTFLSEVNKEYIQAHPERREEMSKRATKTLKRLWADPAYRHFMHEKILKGNKNHITNKTGKVKFDTICKKVIAGGETLSEGTYEQARAQVYPYGSATQWKTGVQKYYSGDVQRIQAEIAGNHKVAQIQFLREYEDVYDLTVDGTHNFALAAGVFVHNSIDGDGAAAMRYTEAKMSRLSMEMMRDIEKDTVLMIPNYDSTKKEPSVLPTAVPNLLLNGTLGIAVGMATNIPPHNLSEVIDATTHLIDNPSATTEDLCEYVKGPDFPLGGIAFGQADIRHAYATGRGGVLVRGEASIDETKNGQFQIIITSLPFRVLKNVLVEKIAELVREKKLEGIKGLRDESTKDIRVVIDLKGGAQPQKVLNYLYKHTELESTFHFNVVALVDGIPQTLSLKGALESFVLHRNEVVRRRTEFDVKRALEKEHILLGLKKALDHIDEIIATIKKSKDTPEAHVALMKKFDFSTIQATAILEMKLQRLAGLERKKIEDELKAVQALIAELNLILASKKKMLAIIKDELLDIKNKYGDERRTKIVKHKAKEFNPEDVIVEKEEMLVYTSGGYVKRTDPSEFRTQKRGGVGVVDMNTKEEDFVTMSLATSSHSDLLFFTDKGKAYQIKMYELPEGKRATRGKSIMNFLQLGSDEKVTSILAMPKDVKVMQGLSLMMITKAGTVKKSAAESFKDVRRSGLIAIKLEAGDELLSALFVGGDESVMLTTQHGQSIRFNHTDVREMGRTATGVIGMKLDKGDAIVASDKIEGGAKGSELLIMTANGYGKKTKLSEYKVQKRGGSGIKTVKVTEKTGKLMVARVVDKETQELLAISKASQVIRTELSSIPTLGRDTQGVRIMKLREGDSLASFNLL